MSRHLWFRALSSIVIISGVTAFAQSPGPVDRHLKWWKDARFGMFIHWGPISLKGQEISWSRDPNPAGPNPGGIPAAEYDALYKRFNPVKLDAPAIVALAKSAGMKYIVFTCKHHDGFCEFDSQYTDYKITSPLSPYGKDIVRQIADATHDAGLHWGVYYSQPDIHHQDYASDHARYNTYFHNQLRELLTNYGPVDLVWFDGLGKSAAFWDAANLFKEIRAVDPKAIVNNRCGLTADYDTPEQTIGGYNDHRPWETCMTIGDQWAYAPNDHYKSAVQCIQTLARCIGGDGNLLLNIGPRPDGTLDPTQVDRLRSIAKWMKVHSRSVYGTRGGPFKPSRTYASTRNGNTVFVHALRWDGDSITLPPLPKQIKGARLMGGRQVVVAQTATAVKITVAVRSQDEADTVIALQLVGSAMDIGPISAQSMQFKNASASNTFRRQAEYAPEKAFDGDDSTRWATDSGTKQCWISADLISPRSIHGVQIEEAYPGRVRRFRFQYKRPGDSNWTMLVDGTHLGSNFNASFKPVTAQSIRLEILDASNGPTISEIAVQSTN